MGVGGYSNSVTNDNEYSITNPSGVQSISTFGKERAIEWSTTGPTK